MSHVESTWVLCDSGGAAVTEISNASSTLFIARRNLGRQCRITLAHTDIESQLLLGILPQGTPQLRYYHDGILRLSGYLSSIEEALEDGVDSLVATFKDPFGRLYGDGSEIGRNLDEELIYTSEDQGSIAWGLIDSLNTAGETGIRLGAVEPTIQRDRTYPVGKHVGSALLQLSEVLEGPDFEFLPLDPVSEGGKLAELTVYASQGSDLEGELLWGFGSGTVGNVLSISRRLTPPINHVRLSSSDIITTVQTDDDSITTHGLWPIVSNTPNDLSELTTLEERASAMLRPSWNSVVTFVPDPEGLQPFEDYWLGDTGILDAHEDSFSVELRPRISGILISTGAEGSEEHEIELEFEN